MLNQVKSRIVVPTLAAAMLVFIVTVALRASTELDRPVIMTAQSYQDSSTDRNTNSINGKSPNGNIQLPSICSSDSCRSDYVRLLQRGDAHPIPEIRHILWKNESVSEYFAQQLATWQKIHPNWTFVLWRDQDMEPFVAAYFPGMLAKFRSLPKQLMQVDMIRYMILYKFGGTYADLDYSLVSSLDQFRRLHAVVTVEPEAHSLDFLEMTWPARLFASPAFLMSAPGHSFFQFVIQHLATRRTDLQNDIISFAGPLGLTDIMETYSSLFPIGNHASDIIFVPPSFSFFPYKDNRLNSSTSIYTDQRFDSLSYQCNSLMLSREAAQQQMKLVQYCTDVNNMDPITDKTQPVIAVHDLQKSLAHCYSEGSSCYTNKLRDVRGVVKHLVLGRDFMLAA